jgi:hypothetical protein
MDRSLEYAPRLARELAGLFDGLLACSLQADQSVEDLSSRLEEAVRTDPRRDLLLSFVTALATDRGSPFASLVSDLAEILFQPRSERSEYAGHPPPPGPWVFPKLMLEYATWARQIDDVVGGLLSPFCARHCPSPPVGCCHLLGYDMGLVPPGMLRLQEMEARLRGWSLPPQPDLDKCRYHTDTGCVLRLFKTPACLQFVCEPMRVALERDCGRERASGLVDALHDLGGCDIDRQVVFEKLERVVRAGTRCASPV